MSHAGTGLGGPWYVVIVGRPTRADRDGKVSQRALRIGFLIASWHLVGCFPSFDGLSGGSGNTAGAATSDVVSVPDVGDAVDAPIPDDRFEAEVEAGPPACPSGGGPSMVRVPTIDGRNYCIDSTEVTQAQYSQFLVAKNGNTSGQDARCTWNTSFGVTCGFDPVGTADYPIMCVDWCDAVAFCKWAGKRLCGKIGGGSLTEGADSTDVSQDQRVSACTHGGRQHFPYGDSENQAFCSFGYHSGHVAAPVASDKNCVGGYGGIYDMIGNAQEWEDACDETDAGPAQTGCIVRGGDYNDPTWDCYRAYPLTRNTSNDWVGFRCCAD